MKLIIAEKYQVASDFAKLLNCTKRNITHNKGNVGYIESADGQWCVSWAAGHLIGMDMPDAYDEKYKRWRMEDLPIFPDKWKYHASHQEPAKSQFKVLKELIHRDDITDIIGATDADREGELIFHEILREVKADPKLQYWRCWYTNTTQTALKNAMDNLEPLSNYKNLNDAANCRQQLDWLWGMNMSRCLTIYSHDVANVGRVVSPTINLIVERQAEIDNFKPEEYMSIQVPVKQDGKTFKCDAKFDDIVKAEELARRIPGADALIEKVEKTSTTETRKLYDLTTLQADASKRFGYEPDTTSKILQDLYDAGWMSYPRTSSNTINPEQIDETEPLPKLAWEKVFASPSQCSPDDFDIMRIVEKKGEGAEASHTGLCPTSEGIAAYQTKIKGDEKKRNIFLIITSRLLCSVLPPRKVDKTAVSVDILGEKFKATGSVETDPGFMDLERYINAAIKSKKERKKTEQVLPEIIEGEIYTCQKPKTAKKETKPPSQYTTAQLLATMKNISTVLKDKKMKELMKNAGLGTAASRDTIIKTIKNNGFVETKGGKLYPTEKAKSLMALLPPDVKSPIMTGQMEMELDKISKGSGDMKAFLEQIKDRIVKEIQTVCALPPIPDNKRYAHNKTFVAKACPKCGEDVVETDKSMVCRCNCGFIVWRTVAGKKIPKTEIAALLKDGHTTRKLDGFKSKKGNSFSCWLYIDGNNEVKFDFDDAGIKAKKDNIIAIRNSMSDR